MNISSRFRICRFLLGSLFLALSVHADAANVTGMSTWRISPDFEAYGANVVQICLFNTGPDRQGPWQALSLADAGFDCHELVVFDMDSQRLYLAFPGVVSTPRYFCQGTRVSGRHPCNSAFYAPRSGSADPRVLDREILRKALRDSGGFALAEQQVAAGQAANRATCDRQLDGATTAQRVRQVMAACDEHWDQSGNARARSKLKHLEAESRGAALTAYRNEFNLASRLGDTRRLEQFIERYKSNDPDQLVPKAISELAQHRKRQAAVAEQQRRRRAMAAKQRAVEQAARDAKVRRQRELTRLEMQIAKCKAAMAAAAEAKARENAIAAQSGYTNPQNLRRAAAVEYDCKQQIQSGYRRYKALGGTRALDQIQ